MSFSARLIQDELTVEAGATTPLSLEIINRGDQPAQFEIAIDGLDPEWNAIPVPLTTIQPGETQNEKIFVKPPRTSESAAGSYPFVVRVRSFENSESKDLQGALHIRPFHQLSLEISPKKAHCSPFRKSASFEATIINLGNASHTIQLFGNDTDSSLAFEIDTPQLPLESGQQKTIEVEVSPKSNRFFSNRLFSISLTARSTEHPNVVAMGQAQLEQRPAMSIGALVAIIFVLVAIGLWAVLIPKAPRFMLNVDSTAVTTGTPVIIRWSPALSDEKVTITALNAPIYQGPGGVGQVSYTPTTTGSINISGFASIDKRRSETESITLNVTTPPVVPDPVIEQFKLDQTNIALGSPVTVFYKVKNADKVVLLPIGKDLDPTVNETQITANNLLTTQYSLVATNSAGKSIEKSISVKITQPSKAKIIAFTASPSKLFAPGTVTLSWQCNSDAVRVELSDGTNNQVVPTTGTQSIAITKNTIFTLTAIDDQAISAKQIIKVSIIPPPAPPIPNAGATAGATGTTDGTIPPSSAGTSPPNQTSSTADGGGSGGAASAGTTGQTTGI